MDNNKQKELIMDEIIIEELQEISGGTISAINTLPGLKPPILSGLVAVPDKFILIGGVIRRYTKC